MSREAAMFIQWKRALLDSASGVFERGGRKSAGASPICPLSADCSALVCRAVDGRQAVLFGQHLDLAFVAHPEMRMRLSAWL
jgi:hypothetical protein